MPCPRQISSGRNGIGYILLMLVVIRKNVIESARGFKHSCGLACKRASEHFLRLSIINTLLLSDWLLKTLGTKVLLSEIIFRYEDFGFAANLTDGFAMR